MRHDMKRYETAQLCAEIGIVLASVGLLVKKRAPWIVSLLLGAAAVAIVFTTYQHTSKEVHEAEHKIKHTEEEYAEARKVNKTTAAEHGEAPHGEPAHH